MTETSSILQGQLGKRLAATVATDKTVRDKALKILEKRLARKQKLSELDLLKVWKALFYCLYMTDKPIVQHELAQRMAKMQHRLFEDNGFLFMKAFWTTVCREWSGIDRYRRDKFYTLVRYFLREEFEFLKKREWKSEALKIHAEIMINGPLSPSPYLAKGLLYHIAAIYWQELNKVQSDWLLVLPVESSVILWEPFLNFLAHSPERIAIKKVFSDFFTEQLNRWKVFIENTKETKNNVKESNKTSASSESKESETSQLSTFDKTQSALLHLFEATSNRLFEFASIPSIAEGNRTILYKTRNKFKNLVAILTRRLKKRKRQNSAFKKRSPKKSVSQLQSSKANDANSLQRKTRRRLRPLGPLPTNHNNPDNNNNTNENVGNEMTSAIEPPTKKQKREQTPANVSDLQSVSNTSTPIPKRIDTTNSKNNNAERSLLSSASEVQKNSSAKNDDEVGQQSDDNSSVLLFAPLHMSQHSKDTTFKRIFKQMITEAKAASRTKLSNKQLNICIGTNNNNNIDNIDKNASNGNNNNENAKESPKVEALTSDSKRSTRKKRVTFALHKNQEHDLSSPPPLVRALSLSSAPSSPKGILKPPKSPPLIWNVARSKRHLSL
jgi:ribosomal RNA-processing protein 1